MKPPVPTELAIFKEIALVKLASFGRLFLWYTGNMKYIQLTQGKKTVVDDADFDYLNQWRWYYKKQVDGNGGYAARNTIDTNGKRGTIRMHQQLAASLPGDRVDHEDGDKLNNRRNNLRGADVFQNQWNRKKQSGSSVYKGVTWHKKEKKWRAQIQVNKRKIVLGRYGSEHEAGMAYLKAAREYFGEYAKFD